MANLLMRRHNQTPTCKTWLLLAVGLWAFLVPSWALVPGNPTPGPKNRLWDFFAKTGISCLVNPFVIAVLTSGKVVCGYENRVDPNCCGEQWDEDLGLYYNRARYLNTDSGRFWSQDSYEGSSSEPQSLHKYLYASANPVYYIDRSGHNATGGDLMLNGIVVHAKIGKHFVGNPPDMFKRANYWPVSSIINISRGNDPAFETLKAIGDFALRPDLTDIASKEVWEIKPAQSFEAAINELDGYIFLLDALDLQGGWHKGTSYSPPSEVTGLMGYKMKVWVSEPGVILYEPMVSQKMHLVAIVAAASVVTMADVLNTVTLAGQLRLLGGPA